MQMMEGKKDATRRGDQLYGIFSLHLIKEN